MYRKIWLMMIVASCNLVSGQDVELEDCYYYISADTVTVGNRLIERQWLWKDGNLVPLSMTKISGTVESVFSHTEKEIERLLKIDLIGAVSGKKMNPEGATDLISTEESSHIVKASAVSGERLVCELTARYQGYQKKAMITVSPGIPAIRISYALKITSDRDNADGNGIDSTLNNVAVRAVSNEVDSPDRFGNSNEKSSKREAKVSGQPAPARDNTSMATSGAQKQLNSGIESSSMSETAAMDHSSIRDDISIDLENKMLDGFIALSKHYNVKTIEFFDQTDGHNNLVEEDHFIPYSTITKRGNLLIAKSSIGHANFFLLKEAPCSSVQLHYPGYDFLVQGTQYAVAGTGVTNGDLVEGRWIPTYSVVSGVQLDDYPLKYSLRLYQKSIRKHDPDRDDMIMLNTWGDRNRDQSINEEFCIREIDACKKYGFTHFQIDDGWQKGLSANSGSKAGKLWDEWEAEHWQPNPDRFPNGFQVVVDYAKEQGVQMGLWFHPSNTNSYEKWERDGKIVVNLYREYGIRYFKIDGIKLPDKRSEVNFRKFLDLAADLSEGNIVFNLDATANRRGGYHFLNEYGNIFLENRYTDWRNYYPHWTLRNLWQLSEYVPPENLQVEFLNVWRNADRYEAGDPLAPSKIPFDYAFAITMAAQPLAWLEASNLPAEAEKIIPIVEQYREVWHQFHKGYIYPIGNEPNGTNWTGFQSVQGSEGHMIVYRELNAKSKSMVKTLLPPGREVSFRLLAGDGEDFTSKVNDKGEVEFKVEREFGFGLYEYVLK